MFSICAGTDRSAKRTSIAALTNRRLFFLLCIRRTFTQAVRASQWSCALVADIVMESVPGAVATGSQ
jgi:hypothetical protein